MRIEIKSIDPAAIRYVTTGDWIWLPDGSLQIFVPDYANENSAFLVALHELAEAWMCRDAGISEESVSKWDIEHPDAPEPAEVEGSPYMDQHSIATQVEIRVAAGMGINWKNHDRWVQTAGDEVERQLNSGVRVARITKEGSRYWAELHLFGLRNPSLCAENDFWFRQWMLSLPFDGCPCEQHLKDFLRNNPTDWSDFFAWSVRLHNSVNDRIGRPTISVENARIVWSSRSF